MTSPESSSYSDPLDWLHQSKWFGMKMDLDNIKILMKRLDSPHLKLKVIHVAGTNGKGSTCSMIYSVLRSAGFSVGLYTSPHLISERERIQVNGEWIPEEDFSEEIKYLQRIVSDKSHQGALKPTYFELMTAAAIHYFWREKMDYVVMETGMGGRLDSTNVVHSQIQIITNIDLDHTQYLGKTVQEIASEKAGIIKPDSIVLTGAAGPALEVIRQTCRQLAVPCLEYPRDIRVQLLERNLSGQKLTIQTAKNEYTLNLHLLGEYQLANAGLAVGAIETLQSGGHGISSSIIQHGIEKAEWPGRFQIISKRPLIVLDAAHNPAGIQALVETWKSYFNLARAHVVFSALSDKDYRGMIRILAPIAERVSLVQIESKRAADLQDLKKEWLNYIGEEKLELTTLKDLMKEFNKESKTPQNILISGSIYLLGQAFEEFQRAGMFKIAS